MGGMEMGFELTPLLKTRTGAGCFCNIVPSMALPRGDQSRIWCNCQTGRYGRRLCAFAGFRAYITKDAKLARIAWDRFLPARPGRFGNGRFDARQLNGPRL